MLEIALDERRNLICPGNSEETIQFAVEHFIKTAKAAIDQQGAFFVALSGGSTPKKIYARLPSFQNAIDWKRVYVFWSDERSVPPSDPDSNYHMAMENGLKSLPIPKKQIFRMCAEADIEMNALLYENQIKTTLDGKPFDLIMLGMGDDGHTASLFPGTRGLHIQDRLVIANEIPQKKTWRMTFTLPLINAAKLAVFYVLGENKKERLSAVLHDPTLSAPAARVGTKAHPALWVIDDKAYWATS